MRAVERANDRGEPSGGDMGSAMRLRAWLVTGPLGRAVAFVIDLTVVLRRGLLDRRRA
jgi:hypothetical protein